MRRARVRRPRMRVRRLSGLSVNRMVPNVLTLLALCAGMTAIRFAMVGNFEGAVFAIIAAGIFDGLDGRMARLLKATSSFGAELDSLADFVGCGSVPLDDVGIARAGLGDRVVLRGVLRAPSGALQRRDDNRGASLRRPLLQRRAGAGRRRPRHDPD